MDYPVKAYYKFELAGLYGVSMQTMRRWLEPHMETLNENYKFYKLVPPIEVQKVFKILGNP